MVRHGFERYNMMRLDPGLCFLAKCGPPDNAAVQVSGYPFSAAGLRIQISFIPDPASALTSVRTPIKHSLVSLQLIKEYIYFIWKLRHTAKQRPRSRVLTRTIVLERA
jgi:hypothetical protein